MFNVEERICQRVAKELGIDYAEVVKIQKSQFKQAAQTIRDFEGKCFALPYIGEFAVNAKKNEHWLKYLEVCKYNRDNNIEYKKKVE